MFILGDVMVSIALVLGIFLTSWAMVLVAGLLFPEHAERSRQAVEESPKRNLLRGVLMLVPLVGLTLVLLNAPNPAVKLMGWVVLLWILGVASIGMAGVTRIVADRIHSMGGATNDFAAMARGSAILLAAGLLPLLGWLAFGPLLLATSLGAGWRAIAPRRVRALETA